MRKTQIMSTKHIFKLIFSIINEAKKLVNDFDFFALLFFLEVLLKSKARRRVVNMQTIFKMKHRQFSIA